MRQLVEAAGGAKEAYQLLLLEHLDTLAETSAKAISNIKFDKVVVWDAGNGAGAPGFLQNMAKTLPPMMQVLRDIAGVELPGYVGTMAQDGEVRRDGVSRDAVSVVPAATAGDTMRTPLSGQPRAD
jgi:flotillin